MQGAPELNAVLQVGSHESGVKGQNHLPRPAGHASLDAAQDTVGFRGCKRTLSAHVELLIHQYLQVLLLRAALEPLSAQPVLVFKSLDYLVHPYKGSKRKESNKDIPKFKGRCRESVYKHN